MVDKNSLAFLLAPPTPTTPCCPTNVSFPLKRLPSPRHRSSSPRDSPAYHSPPPLTAYLTSSTSDAVLSDHLRLQPLSTDRCLLLDTVVNRPGHGPKTLRKKSSKFCMVDGCTSRAKHARRCWKHGGSIQCKMPSCANRAKSKGVCWSHGGGSPCSVDDCDTIAVSNGFCWAHGGGKRCRERGCSRPAYERTHNYCATHFKATAT